VYLIADLSGERWDTEVITVRCVWGIVAVIEYRPGGVTVLRDDLDSEVIVDVPEFVGSG
jgi:hypothetical protein